MSLEVRLDRLSPAAEDGWHLLFGLADAFGTETWMLIGGQMMQLIAAVHGVGDRVLPTDDVDVVVNVRVHRGGIGEVSVWLLDQDLTFSGMSPDGIGHRFERQAEFGPGRTFVDVLAPEGLGERTDISTVPPARTVQAPGTVQAFRRSVLYDVTVTGMTGERERHGRVRSPNLLGALIAKAASTKIAVRINADRDWQDAALLLSVLEDPDGAAAACERNDRKRLRSLHELFDREHVGWSGLDDAAYRQGTATLEFLIDR